MSINRKTRALLAILTPILAISAGVLKTQQQAVAAPQTFTVTNTNNAGSGSLRQAIEDANSNGNPADQDVIEFDILGAGDHVIQPSTSLSITQSVVINGFTQSDSSQNTVLWPGPLDTNIRVAINNIDSGPILVTSNDVTLQGLAIYNSLTSELSIDSSPNFKLYGSHIDMDTTGYMGAKNINANAPGISLTNSPDAVFGDGQAQNRNIFGHCKTQCIKIEGGEGGSSSGAIVRGNYFGVGADGITDANNVRGLTFYNSSAVHLGDGADDSIVGGSSTGQGNSFERLNSAAVWAQDVSGVTILGNRFVHNIGFEPQGDYNLETGLIRFSGVTNSTIGGTTPQDGNYIYDNYTIGATRSIMVSDSVETGQESSNVIISNNYLGVTEYDSSSQNNGMGISIRGGSSQVMISYNTITNTSNGRTALNIEDEAQDVSVIGNSIFNNSDSGIHLGLYTTPSTGNDENDVDSGPNGLLNYPQWTYASESGSDTSVDIMADLPAGDYRIEFFSNSSPDDTANGEGETYLGYSNITSSGTGSENFTHTLTGITGITNLSLTATEIDGSSPTGFGATSEFGGYDAPVADLSITKELTNPESYAAGTSVDYTVTVTNSGESTIDPTALDGTGIDPLQTSVFVDFMPPGMVFNSVQSGDIACSAAPGPLGTVIPGPGFINHPDYVLVACIYNGVDTELSPGESIQSVIRVDLASDFDILLPNIAHSATVEGDIGMVMMQQCANYIFGPDNNGDTDLIDCLLDQQSNGADIVQSEVPHGDFTIAKTLLDREDFVQSGEVTYSLSLANDGTIPINLPAYDGSGYNPLASSLIVDYIPPDMTYLSSSNPDVACSAIPGTLGDLGGPFTNHATYSALFCIYVGTDTLDPTEQISVDLTFQISNDSSLNYTNYATPGWVSGDLGLSTYNNCLSSASEPGATQDALDCLITDTSGNADIAQAGAPTDVEISQSFSAPNGVSPGSAVSYTYTFTNNGPGDISLPWYRATSGLPLFANVFPGSDLTATGSTGATAGIECLDVGSGTAVLLGVSTQDHSSDNLVVCGYFGTDNVTLASGQSIIITLNATVNNGSDGQFTNYLMHTTTLSDPDSVAIGQLLFSATGDILDSIEGYPMFSRLSYPSGSNPGGADNGSGSSNGDLSNTGESIKALVILGLVLMVMAGAVLVASRKKSSSKNKQKK